MDRSRQRYDGYSSQTYNPYYGFDSSPDNLYSPTTSNLNRSTVPPYSSWNDVVAQLNTGNPIAKQPQDAQDESLIDELLESLEKRDAQIKDLQEESANLKSQLDKAIAQAKHLKEQCEDIHLRNSTLKHHIHKLNAENDSLNHDLAAAEWEMRNDRAMAEENIAEKDLALEELQQEHASVVERLKLLESWAENPASLIPVLSQPVPPRSPTSPRSPRAARFKPPDRDESPDRPDAVPVSSKPYDGPRRRLILGIDVGTTFSGVSYSILVPGAVPVVQGVNRYPAQDKVGGDAKIPTVVYYDNEGFVCAVGAEAMQESNIERAREHKWFKAEWFKLHLHPRSTNSDHHQRRIPPLPPNKSVVDVMGDFLRYLYQCARNYIQETHAADFPLWDSFEGGIDFILTHPNGWDDTQRANLRRAAVHGGLVPVTPDGHSHITFVSEGEASLHFCVANVSSDVIKSGEGVVVVDAGGGTIDMSSYFLKASRNWYEAIAPGISLFQGSVFVTLRAKMFLEKKLSNSVYGPPDDIAYIADCFDKSTKLTFKDPRQPSFIKFGSPRDSDPAVDIKFGQLKLHGPDVATFFEPNIVAIVQAIQEQMDAASATPITSVVLVGGFGANHWLFTSIEDRLGNAGLRFIRPDAHIGKAVASGAVSFLLDQFISKVPARPTPPLAPAPNPEQVKWETEKRTEVVWMVEQLNVSIARCAERLAGGLPIRGGDTISDSASSKQLRAMSRFAIGEFIGDGIINMLDAADAAKALQIAVRATLVSCCNYIIGFWDEGHRFEISTQELYRRLKQLVTPNIVLWRTLSESNLEKFQDKEEETAGTAASDMTAFIFTRLSAVVVVAGYDYGLPPKLAEVVLSDLRSITRGILELRCVIGGRRSPFCDLKIVHHRGGTRFDPSLMKSLHPPESESDEDGGSATRAPGLVLCTVDLGLRRLRVVVGKHGVDYVDDVILMPKVLIQSTVEHILAQPS